MPLSKDQLDTWFTYHAPTEDTAPKHAAINEAFERFGRTLQSADGLSVKDQYTLVNNDTRGLAEVIDTNCPDSDDKTAAIRCVRLVRNFLNEVITNDTRKEDCVNPEPLVMGALTYLYAARFQANSAIACGGK